MAGSCLLLLTASVHLEMVRSQLQHEKTLQRLVWTLQTFLLHWHQVRRVFVLQYRSLTLRKSMLLAVDCVPVLSLRLRYPCPACVQVP